MTKKLEEVLNLLPEIEDMMPDAEKSEEEEVTVEDLENEIVEYSSTMSIAERADAALPIVTGLDELEREMDEYAKKAMSTFDDLVDLGKNVEDRHAAPIFDSASKMIQAALQAKTAKMDKKIKMIELQMRQRKADLDDDKFNASQGKGRNGENEDASEGIIIGDRSELLNEIMKNMKENDK